MSDKPELLPRDLSVRPFDGYARPCDLNIWLDKINDLIFDDEYVNVVEQTHAIDLRLGWRTGDEPGTEAEHPTAIKTALDIPPPDFGMTGKEKRELGKAVKKLRRTT